MRAATYKNFLHEPEYDFLDTNPHLGKNISLLYLGGSLAYGLETPESDVDIRGFALSTIDDYLLMKDFEQVERKNPDVTIYSANKFLHLLKKANPNLIEVFDAPILQFNHIWCYVLDNKDAFLSNLAVNSFRGFALQQEKRLLHYRGAAPVVVKTSLDWEKNIADSTKFENNGAMRKIAKYESNCIRCFRMGAELFRTGEVHTYRGDIDAEELMEIKMGKWVRGIPAGPTDPVFTAEATEEFFTQVEKEREAFEDAAENSVLPDLPDEEKIESIRKEIGASVLGALF